MAKDVDAYIAKAPKASQAKLKELRRLIKRTIPGAKESISYRMPHYNYMGRVAWFAPMGDYIGLYIVPPIVEEHRKVLAGYKTTKSAIHLPMADKLPASLIQKLLRARVKLNEAKRAV